MAGDTVLVVCESVLPEVEKLASSDLDIKVLEFGLHNHPNRLNEKLRECLAEIERDERYKTALFGYGLCSEGVVGLKPQRVRIVIPKTDDCIALFLGSKDRYFQEQRKEPGTFYLTKGWIEYGENPLSIYNQDVDWAKKYPPEKARWVAKEVMKNYKRIALIDTGVYDSSSYEDYARKTAEIFDMKYEVIPGSVTLLEKLLSGDWDENFIVVEPGQEVTKEMFFDTAGNIGQERFASQEASR